MPPTPHKIAANTISLRETSGSILLLLIVLGCSAVIIKHNHHDDAFVYVAVVWTIACVAGVLSFRSNALRAICLCLGSMALVCSLFEAYLAGWFPGQHRSYLHGSLTRSGLYEQHPLLGYALKKNIQTSIQGHHQGELLYDFTLTTNEHGFRQTPQSSSASTPAVLFLGGSFTFGHGVSDTETAPSVLQEAYSSTVKTFNFGVNGYGPHQMLAILENGIERQSVKDDKPTVAIYQAIPSHIDRVAGRAMWDQAGPRYRLDESQGVLYAGAFHGAVYNTLFTYLKKSQILNRMLAHWLNRQKPNPSDTNVFIEIIKKSARIFRERYGGEFYVLLWDFASPAHQDIVAHLVENNVNILHIADILPHDQNQAHDYRIPHDNHPNSLAHYHIAQYLRNLLQEKIMAVP